MRVLYFHQHFSTPKGATGIRSYEMAKALVKRGHQVTMVCGSYGAGQTGIDEPFEKGIRKGNVDGIDVIEFDLAYSNSDGFLKRSVSFMKFAVRSIGIAMSAKYDLIFATTTPLTAGIPGIFARWLRRKPFVFEVRDLWPELPKAMGVIRNPVILWAMAVLERTSYRSAHRCIGLSPGIVDGIASTGKSTKDITMIPNGCDLNIFDQTSAAWRPPGVADSDFMAIFTGTHGIANGLDAVLDAAAVLKRKNINNIKLVLVGQGRCKDSLKARADKEDLGNVIFHDPVDKAKLSGLMSSADIGMQVLANVPAFYYGTSPNKFFDYISSGLPVINNYPGWLADMITENAIGYVVEPNNPEAFADALTKAASSDQLDEMGARAKELAKRRFNRADLSGDFVTWLEGAKK